MTFYLVDAVIFRLALGYETRIPFTVMLRRLDHNSGTPTSRSCGSFPECQYLAQRA